MNSRFLIDDTHSGEDFDDLCHHGGISWIEALGEEDHTARVVHHSHQPVLRITTDLQERRYQCNIF